MTTAATAATAAHAIAMLISIFAICSCMAPKSSNCGKFISSSFYTFTQGLIAWTAAKLINGPFSRLATWQSPDSSSTMHAPVRSSLQSSHVRLNPKKLTTHFEITQSFSSQNLFTSALLCSRVVHPHLCKYHVCATFDLPRSLP